MSFRYGLLALAMAVVPAWAQSVISAQSGLIHYVEGRVLVDGQPVEAKIANFPILKEKQELRTEEGRVEVLLTPGVFLRLGENSSMRMISTRLTDSRFEFTNGAAVIEVVDLLKDNQITVTFKDWNVTLHKNGLYRFDSEPAQLRVHSGEAVVEAAGQILAIKEGRCLPYGPSLVVEKFDKEANDSLFRWAQRRSDYIALANVSAARSIERNSQSWGQSGWFWNSYYGMFTFVPYRSSYFSPFGYRYWSPVEVYQVYASYYPQTFGYRPGGGGQSSLGYSTIPRTYTGNSGAVAAAAPAARPTATTSAASAATAPVARESGHAGSRGR